MKRRLAFLAIALVVAAPGCGDSGSKLEPPPGVVILRREWHRWDRVADRALARANNAMAAHALGDAEYWETQAEHAGREQNAVWAAIVKLEQHLEKRRERR